MIGEERLKVIEEAISELSARVDDLSPRIPAGTSQEIYEEYFGPQDRLEKIEERLEALIQFLSKSHPDLLQTIGVADAVQSDDSLLAQEEIDEAVNSRVNPQDYEQ